jgi:hypothetical protein
MDTSRRLLGNPRWSHEGSTRPRDTPVADPALIRILGVGQVGYIHHGGVTYIQVKRLLAAPAALARRAAPGWPQAGQEPTERRPEPVTGLPVPAAGPPADGAEHPALRPASAAAALLDEAFGPEPG